MKEKKRVFKLFWAWQDEEEEKWLSKMAEEGWHLKKGPWIYTFGKGEPENAIYKLDFNRTSQKDRDEYLTLFQDAGWEHITEYMSWHYFKSNKERVIYPDIYSDKESKIQKYKTMLAMETLLLAAIIIIASAIIFPSTQEYFYIVKWIYSILILLLLFVVIRLFYKIRKIKRD